MANTKASKKDIRRIEVRTARNVVEKSRLKTLRKKVITASEAPAEGDVRAYNSALDKAAKRNVIHRNKANRQKSRAAKRLKAAAAS